MRIGFVAGTLGQGGAEKQLFLLALELKRKGHKVFVASLLEGEFWHRRLIDSGVETYSIGKYASKIQKLVRLNNWRITNKIEIIYAFHFYVSVYTGVLRIISFQNLITIGSIRNNGISEFYSIGSIFGLLVPRFKLNNDCE